MARSNRTFGNSGFSRAFGNGNLVEHRMRIESLFATAAIALAPVAAQAQSAPASPGPDTVQSGSAPEKDIFDGNYLIVGAGAVYGPSYVGSNDYVLYPAPLAQGRVAGIGVSLQSDGLTLNFVPHRKGAKIGFAFGPLASYSTNRDTEIEDPVVRAAGKLKADIAVGASGGVIVNRLLDRYDNLSVTVDVKWDVRGPHGGMEVTPSVTYVTPLSKAVLAVVALSAEHDNDGYADYYYSVSPTQSAASGLPLYHARGGWMNVGATMLLGYSLRGDLRKRGLSLFVLGGYTRLLNDARDNPYTSIRGTPTQWLGGGGIAYTF
jgi:outer membrane scaffolding protein for murein synthesis (MipA/OmpV family)